jgi:two-component system sensor histidine kinase/response regulator
MSALRLTKMSANSNFSFDPLRVLLVGDDAVTQRDALASLKARGAVVTVAENGRDAIEAWAISRFDVILMDTQAPELDGFDVARIVRAREDVNEHVPIIALTTRATASDVRRCTAAGMDDCIVTPLDPNHMLDAIDRLVGVTRVDAGTTFIGACAL